MINARHNGVLRAIVQDYIRTAEPVGSRTISRKYGFSLSPATIRNIMADLRPAQLDDLGLVPALRWYIQQNQIRQPGVSAVLLALGMGLAAVDTQLTAGDLARAAPMVRNLRELLARLRAAGHCVLFSSHVMQEVAGLCDEVVVIAQGRVVAQGAPDALLQSAGAETLEDAFVTLVERGAAP